MKIIINDKNLGIDIMEIVDIPNANEHFRNLSCDQWQKIKKHFDGFEVFDDSGTSLYKWENK
jgi:ribosomal protein S4E